MKKITAFLIALTLTACAPQATNGYATVTVKELKAAIDGGSAYVLDVRTPAEFAEGHIAKAINLPLDQVKARVDEVPNNKTVYVICRSGNRSAQASEILNQAGKNVKNVAGGMNDWSAATYPINR